MDVPFCHDGGSNMFFPEAYPGDGKILVEIKVAINNPSIFYPKVPGINDRKWEKGERVYVPASIAGRFIQIKWMEKIED
jgi:hypothetical protein